MLSTVPTTTEALFFDGLVFTFVVWLGSSAFVVINRLLYDHRERRLMAITRELTEPALALLPPLERSPAIRGILSRKSRRALYRMVATPEFPIWVTDICAAYAIEKWGLPRMMLDAATHRRRRKWRRISALFALGHIGAPNVHDLLEVAVFDPDPDVAGAAVVILHRLGDRRAAEILIAALREQSFSSSRIATQLEQFAIPIDDLLRLLLVDPRPHARYWGASLLMRYPGVPGLEAEVAALIGDSDPPVRKAALETLGAMSGAGAVVAAQRLLGDSVAYVRSTAIRSLAQHGTDKGDPASHRALAVAIVPSLADGEWHVRLAAKEALVALGPDIWREVAVQLDSPDEFARNGASEVLQNVCLLDKTMEDFGRGIEPSTELVNVLARAFQEGGHAMVDAAITRLKPEFAPAIENLLAHLRLIAVRAA